MIEQMVYGFDLLMMWFELEELRDSLLQLQPGDLARVPLPVQQEKTLAQLMAVTDPANSLWLLVVLGGGLWECRQDRTQTCPMTIAQQSNIQSLYNLTRWLNSDTTPPDDSYFGRRNSVSLSPAGMYFWKSFYRFYGAYCRRGSLEVSKNI